MKANPHIFIPDAVVFPECFWFISQFAVEIGIILKHDLYAHWEGPCRLGRSLAGNIGRQVYQQPINKGRNDGH